MIIDPFSASFRASILVGIFILSLPGALTGQKTFPPPSENPYWIEKHAGLSMSDWIEYDIVVYYKSDTVIGSQTYNRLYRNGNWTSIYTLPPYYHYSGTLNEELFAVLRQDTTTRKVYVFDNNTEVLLYDFKNLAAGAEYPNTHNNPSYMSDTLVVVSEDSTQLNNAMHRIWNLGHRHNGVVSDSAFVSIIEGIGSTFGLLAQLVPPFENFDELKCFYSDSTGIYPDSLLICDRTFGLEDQIREIKIKVYPNPADRALSILLGSNNDHMQVQLCDLSGRTLISRSLNNTTTSLDLSHLKDGLYVLVFIRENNMIETRKLVIRRP